MNSHRKKLDYLLTEYQHLSRSVKEERQSLKKAKRRLRISLQVQSLLQSAAQTIQQNAHKRIAAVVTKCLQAVFGEDAYEFRITFNQKRGKTEAVLSFVRDGVEVDPTESSGGGAIDVAAFALRVASLMMSIPRRRRFLALDEPFRFVSEEYRPMVRSMLEQLSKEMGIQILMVTHSRELMTGKVIEL